MLRIDQRVLAELSAATRSKDVVEFVWQAVRLEFSTIPPYLTAMLSLHPGKNREVWNTIHDVVVDEMLHMTIACNLLNALGGRPNIDSSEFLPRYPTQLPMAINSLVVGLEPYSPELMKRVFMEIEEPENPIPVPFTERAGEAFATIGQFYAALITKLEALGDGAFIGDPARQVVASTWFGPRVFALTDVASAVRAIELVVDEGEGTALSPLDPDGDLAHYYRFSELWRLRRIVSDASSSSGWSHSGDVVPYDPAAVYPITPNQKLADLDFGSQAGHRA